MAETVRPPLRTACVSCPWRTSNQGGPEVPRPPGHLDGEGLRFYEKTGRDEVWWLRPGAAVRGHILACHQHDPTQGAEPITCAGAWGLQCRALLRMLEGETDGHPLTDDGTQTILLRLGAGPNLMRMRTTHPRALAGWVRGAAPPATLDPELSTEAVPAPTPAELARWT
jgi:hypothetical protein